MKTRLLRSVALRVSDFTTFVVCVLFIRAGEEGTVAGSRAEAPPTGSPASQVKKAIAKECCALCCGLVTCVVYTLSFREGEKGSAEGSQAEASSNSCPKGSGADYARRSQGPSEKIVSPFQKQKLLVPCNVFSRYWN